MATREQIEQVDRILQNLRPAPFFKKVNESNAGLGAVMRLLYESREPVTAGGIAEFMDVSTARVAVLLKKMEAKGWIVKERDPADARVTIVRLSELGLKKAQTMEESMHSKVGEVIDQVGMDRVLEFLAVAAEIGRILPEPGPMDDCLG